MDLKKSSCSKKKFLRPLKRGRPRKDDIQELIGDEDWNQCPYCIRRLKRKKSLTTHLRVHTGEKPYVCTFPRCNSAFKQSGHLKTHYATHTKEQPFACPISGCTTRYSHSSRTCKKHGVRVKRDGLIIFSRPENVQEDQLIWIKKYEERERKKARKGNPNRSRNTSGSSGFNEENIQSSSLVHSPAARDCDSEALHRSPSQNEQRVPPLDEALENKENMCSNMPSVFSPSSSSAYCSDESRSSSVDRDLQEMEREAAEGLMSLCNVTLFTRQDIA